MYHQMLCEDYHGLWVGKNFVGSGYVLFEVTTMHSPWGTEENHGKIGQAASVWDINRLPPEYTLLVLCSI